MVKSYIFKTGFMVQCENCAFPSFYSVRLIYFIYSHVRTTSGGNKKQSVNLRGFGCISGCFQHVSLPEVHVMSLESAHDSLAIKYDIVLQQGNPLPSGLAATTTTPTPPPPNQHHPVILRCMARRSRYLGEISEVPWHSQVQLL